MIKITTKFSVLHCNPLFFEVRHISDIPLSKQKISYLLLFRHFSRCPAPLPKGGVPTMLLLILTNRSSIIITVKTKPSIPVICE